MTFQRLRTAVVLPMVFLIPFTIALGGCAPTPPAPERPDGDKIHQDSDKSMQDLKKEEDRRGNGY